MDNTDTPELFVPIDGFPKYEVSNHGRVRSLHGTSPRFRKHVTDSKGYVRIKLQSSPGTSKTLYLHRLVALAFVPNPSQKREVDHIDGNPSNNHSSNLRWLSHKQNLHAAYHRRGNWLANFPRKTVPFFMLLSPSESLEFPSIASACRHIGKSQSASPNLIHSAKNNSLSYGFHWSYSPLPSNRKYGST